MEAPLGWGQVPHGQLGWDGHWGSVPIQGPVPRPKGWVAPPEPWEIASAMVVTYWTCPFCQAECDVWGEGAINSWMECPECWKSVFLQFDDNW